LKYTYSDLYVCYFLCSPKYNVFKQDFWHVGGINSWLHANVFSKILKLKNMFFHFFNKMKSLVPCAPNLYPNSSTWTLWSICDVYLSKICLFVHTDEYMNTKSNISVIKSAIIILSKIYKNIFHYMEKTRKWSTLA
jgi:hypothetical protein